MADAPSKLFWKYGAAEPLSIPLRFQQRGARQTPTCLVGRADQAAGKMSRAIRGAVEMGAVPSGFAMKEPPRGVIPRHQTAEQDDMAMPGRCRAVFVGGATQ